MNKYWNQFWFGNLADGWAYSVFRILWAPTHLSLASYTLYWSLVEYPLPPLPYPGIGAVFSYLPLGVVVTLSLAQMLVGVVVLIGYRTRLMQWLAWCLALPLFFYSLSLYQNHYAFYLFVSFYAALMPSERFYSVDAWQRRRSTSLSSFKNWQHATVSLLPQRLVLMQLSCLYLFAGLNKLTPDWWYRYSSTPELIWLSQAGWHLDLWQWLLEAGLTVIPLGLVAFTMLALVPGLFIANRYPVIVLGGMAMHVLFELTLPILDFTGMCIAGLFLALFPVRSRVVAAIIECVEMKK